MTYHRPALALALILSAATPAPAHKLRLQGQAVAVAGSTLSVTPSRDWNSLSRKPGKNAESWTLDGEQLNEITFFGGVPAGSPLVKERSKKQAPLPKFTGTTLLVEVPELLEGTYRTYKNSGAFQLLSTQPGPFLGKPGVVFTYAFTDEDELTSKGEGRAAIIDGKLYMITYEAPSLHFFDRSVEEFHRIAESAKL